MITIISGTNRSNALSLKLSRIYQKFLNNLDAPSQIIDLSELPPDFAFSALYEQSGRNKLFNVFRQQMKDSDKFVYIVPEYNGSFPGILKTFIDGLEFPVSFQNKKCALVGLSAGVQGAGLALSHLTDIFNYCGMHVLALKPKLAQIEENMDVEKEEITNPLYKELIEMQARQLVAF
ncbi:MAG: NAD(P)H-dependent oxidoreductase [Bacteroidetes bacterium]|nr:NAD(P)H-dependent oxidoreductase [Bacteroidota bacterium]MCH8232997.1 NAD(P)H-dependent oxidoreductase [Bacteroidota bacterium]